MSSFTKKDAAKGTKSNTKEVSRAWHQAREDAQKSDHPYDKSLTKDWNRTPDSERDKK